jgi:hypothetical protein
MKTSTNIRLFATVLIGMIIIIIGSCKKDKETETSDQVPVVTTSVISDVTSSTVIFGGNVTSQGSDSVTSLGVCWSTSENPTINDAKTIDSKGTGSFVSIITGLADSTRYYVRAYATNSKGTGYGETRTFTTRQEEDPWMNFIVGAGLVSSDVTLHSGEEFNAGIYASSSVNLAHFKIVRTFNNIPFMALDTSLNSRTFNLQIIAQAMPIPGSERWTFTVTNIRGKSKELQFVITTEAGGEINSYTDIVIGGQLNPSIGSFYATLSNDVMTSGEADLNQSKVDMIYYYGNTNMASIVAPASEQIALIPELSYITDAGNANHWTVTNQTKFKPVLGLTWNDITDDTQIIQYATNFTDMNANQLVPGEIIAFETAVTSANAGKKGLFRVKAINGTSANDRSITIDVKIQR